MIPRCLSASMADGDVVAASHASFLAPKLVMAAVWIGRGEIKQIFECCAGLLSNKHCESISVGPVLDISCALCLTKAGRCTQAID